MQEVNQLNLVEFEFMCPAFHEECVLSWGQSERQIIHQILAEQVLFSHAQSSYQPHQLEVQCFLFASLVDLDLRSSPLSRYMCWLCGNTHYLEIWMHKFGSQSEKQFIFQKEKGLINLGCRLCLKAIVTIGIYTWPVGSMPLLGCPKDT